MGAAEMDIEGAAVDWQCFSVQVAVTTSVFVRVTAPPVAIGPSVVALLGQGRVVV